MYRQELVKFKIDRLIEDESRHDFTEFMQIARRIHGVNRRLVASDTGISHTHLFYIETGYFMKPPKKEISLILGKYYGIPEELIRNKAIKFISEGKNTWRGKNATCKRKSCEDEERFQREYKA